MPINPIASFYSISIVLRPLLGFGLGIIVAHLFVIDSITALFLLLLTIVLYAIVRLFPASTTNNWPTSVSLLLLLIGFAAIGMLRYSADKPTNPTIATSYNPAIYSITIAEQTKINSRSQQYKGYITGLYGDSLGWKPLSIQTQVSTNMKRSFTPGSQILVYARAEPLRALSNPDSFDYHQWLIEQQYQATLWVDSSRYKLVAEPEDLPFIANLQNGLLLQIDRQIDDLYSRSILKAIALGDKLELDRETKQAFSQSGAMHLLVVSGLHTGILFMMVQLLLFFLGNRPVERIIRFVILVSLLWLYVALTGGANPVLRAAIMLTIMELSRLLNYRSLSFNNLFIAAFVILMIHPGDLFAVGFQLSFSAVLSILYFSGYKRWWLPASRYKSVRWFYDLLFISVGVQIGVAPLVAFYFQSFPLWFLPTNLIAIPLVTILLPLYVLSVITTPLPLVSDMLFGVLEQVLMLVKTAISTLAALPLTDSWAPSLTFIELAILYLLIVLMVRWVVYPYYLRTITFLLSVILVLIYSSYNLYFSLPEHKPYIMNNLRNSRVIVDGKVQYSGLDSGYIAHDCLSLYMMKGRGWYRKSTPIPLVVDYLVVDRHIYPSLDYLNALFSYQILVLDGSIRGEMLTKWEQEIAVAKEPIAYYSLYKTGGLIIE